HHGQHGEVSAHVSAVDSEHEPHRVEELDQRTRLAGLDVNPGLTAIVDETQLMLDVPVRAEYERLSRAARLKVVDLLRAEAVQPAKPVGSGNRDQIPVGAVDESGRLRERP